MKLLLAVTALVALVSTNQVSSSDPRCPPRDGQFPVYYRDENDCSIFYQCSNGASFKFDCPAGTLFDTTLNVCNWPDAVVCEEGSGGESGEGSGDESEEEGSGDEPVIPDADELCKDVPSNVYRQFPHLTDCSKYFTCSHQRAVEQVCPANLHYNPVAEVCDVPERAGCLLEELLEFSKA